MHPYNELDFEARIQRALLYLGGAKENERIKADLVKMLKPTKYIDDRDQIYYALGEIALKEGSETNAIEDFHKSVKASTTNKVQKAITFLALANISFNHENYRAARNFYDSTIIALPKKFRGRDTILAKKENLDRLVRSLNVIDREDSLQRIAKRGPKGAEKYVDSLIASEKRKEEEKQEQEKQALESNQNPVNPNAGQQQQSNGKWYFYNPSTVSQGITDFTRQWGNRILEDDWRRSRKISSGLPSPGVSEQGSDTAKRGTLASKDSVKAKDSRSAYMKNIPLTDAQLKASDDTLIEAYYDVGFIYKEYIKNYRKGEADFEEMLSRFPEKQIQIDCLL